MKEKKLDEALSNRFSHTIEDAHEFLSDPDAIKDAADKAAESVAEYIHKHPIQIVGAALAVGLVAGLLIQSRR